VLQRDEALGELARRYFVGHGPASLLDFVGWTKLTMKDARAALSIARPSLVECTLNDISYFMSPDTLESPLRTQSSVVALPGFDEYVLGYKDRSAVLSPKHAQTIVPGNNGMFMPTIVVDGTIVGTWRRTHKSKETLVEAIPFVTLSRVNRRAFEHAAKAYGDFVGSPIRVAS